MAREYVLKITEVGKKNDVVDITITSDELVPIMAFILDMDGEEDEEVEEPVKEKRHYKKRETKNEFSGKKERKPSTCSKCGEVGHKSHHCPSRKEVLDDHEEVEEVDDEPHTPSSIDTSQAVLRKRALSEHQFNMIRERKHMEMSSKEIAEDMNVPIQEVNLIFKTTSYDVYLEIR